MFEVKWDLFGSISVDVLILFHIVGMNCLFYFMFYTFSYPFMEGRRMCRYQSQNSLKQLRYRYFNKE